MPGIIMSSRTRSGFSTVIFSSASRPLLATRKLIPLCLKAKVYSFTKAGSSSTSKTLLLVGTNRLYNKFNLQRDLSLKGLGSGHYFNFGRGGENRTPSPGFGDPWFTINQHPYESNLVHGVVAARGVVGPDLMPILNRRQTSTLSIFNRGHELRAGYLISLCIVTLRQFLQNFFNSRRS